MSLNLRLHSNERVSTFILYHKLYRFYRLYNEDIFMKLTYFIYRIALICTNFLLKVK